MIIHHRQQRKGQKCTANGHLGHIGVQISLAMTQKMIKKIYLYCKYKTCSGANNVNVVQLQH